MSLEIRRATRADRDRCVAIVFDTLRAYGIEPEPEGLDADVLRIGQEEGDAFEVVAVIDGVVAGVSALAPRGPKEDAFGWVSKVFVEAAYRRRGAARALMRAVVDEARARNYRRLGLQTRTIFAEAIALYESSGWKRGDAPRCGPCDRTYFLDL